jgi:hypothetical protein
LNNRGFREEAVAMAISIRQIHPLFGEINGVGQRRTIVAGDRPTAERVAA